MRLFQASLCAAILLASCSSSEPIAPAADTAHTDGHTATADVLDTAAPPPPPNGVGSCPPLPLGAPLLYGPDVTLTPCAMTVRVQAGDAPTTVHLPLAASVPGMRWTVKVWGDDANNLTFLPAVDPETGLMDGMNDIDGDALLDTSGGNPAVVLEAFGDTDGPDGPGAPGGPDMPGWMVISR